MKFIPTIPGHYWYQHPGDRLKVIDVIIFDRRSPWTYWEGHGIKVRDLPGRIIGGRLEDDLEIEGSDD